MIDALLYSVRDGIRDAGYGYAEPTCNIQPDGQPPPACGDVYVAVHQAATAVFGVGRYDAYYAFGVTLTMRVRGIPLDRVGDKLLAVKLAKAVGFNRRADQLGNLLNAGWGLLGPANTYLCEVGHGIVYGFCEPPLLKSVEIPVLVGGEWFSAAPEAEDVGLKAELKFGECRRFQATGTFE